MSRILGYECKGFEEYILMLFGGIMGEEILGRGLRNIF
jgi:hypothetical protein